MMLNFIWNVDPKLFSIGPFQVSWLTLFLVAGVLAGRYLLISLCRKDETCKSDVKIVFNLSIIGALIGARLFYVAFIDPSILFNSPLQAFFPFDFKSGFRFTGSNGFSMPGGLAGIIIASIIYSRVKKISFQGLLDKAVILLVVVMIFLRVGNFFQSEYFGKPTDSPTGILAINKVEQGLLKLPCCAMRNPNGENPLDTVSVKKGNTMLHKGVGFQPLIAYLFFKDGATEQLVNEFLIGDVKTYLFELLDMVYEPGTEPLHYTIFVEGPNYMARIQTIGITRHPLQLYEGFAFIILLLAMILYWNKHLKNILAGRMAGLLIMSISGIHFLTEFMNVLPRPVIKSLPLTIDQYISLPIFLFGLVLSILSYKARKIKP